MNVKPLELRSVRGASSSIVILLGIAFTALLFGAIGWAGTQMTLEYGRISPIWLGNALVIAILLRTRKRLSLAFVGTCFLANVAVAVSFGDSNARALLLASINAFEIMATVILMRRLCGQYPDISMPKTLVTMMLIGVTVPILSGFLTAGEMAVYGQGLSMTAWTTWYGAHALALMIITPIVLIALDSWQNRYRPSYRQVAGWLLLVVGTTAGTVVVFTQSKIPYPFLATPLVIVAAFRSGMLGTAVAVAIVSIVATIATLMGIGPIMRVDGDLPQKIRVLEVFLATNFVIGLPIAAILETRSAIGQQLQESRDFAQDILQNVGEVIFKTDAEGRWTFLNEAWPDLTGYRIDESIGWYTTRLLHPDDRSRAIETYKDIVSGKISDCVLSQRFYDMSGELKYIEVSVRRLSYADGSFAGTIGNIRDNSWRVAQETALKESERRFQTLADVAPAGIFRTNPEGQCTYVNPAWLSMTGVADGQWQGSGWAAAIHPDDLKGVTKGWASVVEQKTGFRGEIRWVHKNGAIACTDVVATPEYCESGELCGFIGVLLDISDRKLAECELADREAQLALLANNATDSVMRLSLDGTCLYASPSSKHLFGVHPSQLVGQSMWDRFHPDDDESIRNTFDALAGGHQEQAILAFRSEKIKQPGAYFWMEANCGLVRDPRSDEPIEIIASMRDVSQTKALESNLREASARAELAAAAQSAFLANMSHEIRTPMNGVIGFTELALTGDLPPVQRRQIEMIAKSGRVMMHLLNDILDRAKIEAGQMSIVHEAFDLPHKLQGSVRMMEPVAITKGVALTLAIDDDVPRWVLGDQMRVRQIILNLIGNAIKFTEHGTVVVTAAIDRTCRPPRLDIAVRDSGIGISPDRIKAVFDHFAQADGSTARKFGGTGLGLSISLDLAKLMGGTISVDSVLGEGSTFTLSIPFKECAAPVAANEDNDRGVRVRLENQHVSRILLAEDHDINQELVMAMAERAGFDADIAVDGAEAVRMVKRADEEGKPYALVLMDIQMPVLDGYQATRRLRAEGFDAARLPIVALTANAYAEDIAACLDAGMQGHIAKPVGLSELSKTVSQWIGKSTITAPVVEEPVIEEIVAAIDLQNLFTARMAQTAEAVRLRCGKVS